MTVYKPTYRDKATGETRKVAHYYLRHRGRRYPLHVFDRRVAETKARELINQIELGYDPKKLDRARFESLTDLIDEYGQSKIASLGQKQRYQVRLRLTKLVKAVRATTLGDLTVEKVQQWLNKSLTGLRTRHNYRTTVKAFGAWLVETHRHPRNTFAKLEKVKNIETDRKLVRRALSSDEFVKLVATTEQSLRRCCKLTGRQRAMLYRVVANTGLRRGEVSSLKPSSFVLKEDGGVSFVRVTAAFTKNKKAAMQPLPSSLVPALRDYLRGLPDQPVWPVSGCSTSLMVHRDLEEAGIPVMEDGMTFDFHALRGQFATALILAGVDLAKAQKLLRHSTPALTSNLYTHLKLEDLGREVEKLA